MKLLCLIICYSAGMVCLFKERRITARDQSITPCLMKPVFVTRMLATAVSSCNMQVVWRFWG
jgi:hypothetical protein